MEFHRGRLIDHIRLQSRDIEASREFYGAVLAVLGVKIEREGDGWFLADELMVVATTTNKRAGRMHIALQARDNVTVDRFYEAALDAGAKKESPPARGNVHPYYYSATVRDPDGNAIEAVCHGPITRSAASVVVKPSAMKLLRSWF
ncbi:MAG: VOC family protein [Hyphomicrobiaceae bacterium]|nr:VOC family protein [Hyphomicrobiaceae bacterium]